MALYLNEAHHEDGVLFVRLLDEGDMVADFRVDQAITVAEEIVGMYAVDHDVAHEDEIVLDYEIVKKIHAMLTAAAILSKDSTIAEMAKHIHERVGERERRTQP